MATFTSVEFFLTLTIDEFIDMLDEIAESGK